MRRERRANAAAALKLGSSQNDKEGAPIGTSESIDHGDYLPRFVEEAAALDLEERKQIASRTLSARKRRPLDE
jgi:hypothetical protein